MDHRNEELHDFAARKRAEWTEVTPATLVANTKYADGKAAINARFVELRLAGMESDEAGNLIRETMGRPNMVIDAEEDASCDTLEELKQMWT